MFFLTLRGLKSRQDLPATLEQRLHEMLDALGAGSTALLRRSFGLMFLHRDQAPTLSD